MASTVLWVLSIIYRLFLVIRYLHYIPAPKESQYSFHSLRVLTLLMGWQKWRKVLEMSDLGSAPKLILASGKSQIWSREARFSLVLQLKLFTFSKKPPPPRPVLN